METNENFNAFPTEEQIELSRKKANRFWKIVSVISALFLVIVISISFYNNRLTACDCQESWLFSYAEVGEHKINLYSGERFDCIDVDDINHCERLIDCADKFGKQSLVNGFRDSEGCNDE